MLFDLVGIDLPATLLDALAARRPPGAHEPVVADGHLVSQGVRQVVRCGGLDDGGVLDQDFPQALQRTPVEEPVLEKAPELHRECASGALVDRRVGIEHHDRHPAVDVDADARDHAGQVPAGVRVRRLPVAAHAAPVPVFLELRRVLHVRRPAPPFAGFDFDDPVVLRGLGAAEHRVHERCMRNVDAVLNDSCRFRIPAELGRHHAPFGVAVLVARRYRKSFAFGKIAQEYPDHAVALLDGIGIDASPPRRLEAVALGGYVGQSAVPAVAPAMVRTDHAVPIGPAAAERTAAMQANVRQAVGLSGFVAIEDKLLAQQLHAQRLPTDIPRPFRDVPEVDQHGATLLSYFSPMATTLPEAPPNPNDICQGRAPARPLFSARVSEPPVAASLRTGPTIRHFEFDGTTWPASRNPSRR